MTSEYTKQAEEFLTTNNTVHMRALPNINMSTQFIHPLDDELRYEARINSQWQTVTDAEQMPSGELVCRLDSQDTLTCIPAGEWRRVRASAA